MAVQYIANAISKSGGGASGSWPKNDKGPIKIYLMGYIILARVFCQAIADPAPGNQSPFAGNSRTSGPKSELVIN